MEMKMERKQILKTEINLINLIKINLYEKSVGNVVLKDISVQIVHP